MTPEQCGLFCTTSSLSRTSSPQCLQHEGNRTDTDSFAASQGELSLSDAGDLGWEHNLARLYDGLQHLESDGQCVKADPLHALYALMNVLVPPSPPHVTLSHVIKPLDIPRLGALWCPSGLDKPKQSLDHDMILKDIPARPCEGRGIHPAPSPCRGDAASGPLDTAGLAPQPVPDAPCASSQSSPPLQAGSSCAVSSSSFASYVRHFFYRVRVFGWCLC